MRLVARVAAPIVAPDDNEDGGDASPSMSSGVVAREQAEVGVAGEARARCADAV